MTAIASSLQRIPKVALFAAVAVIQFALLAVMIIDRMQILRDGAEVALQTRPVDPRDIFRGDYVRLGYDISEVPAGALQGQPAGTRTPTAFVKLTPDANGLYQAVSVHAEAVPVTSPDILIRGRIALGANCGPNAPRFCAKLRINYNLERYFVPEGEGLKLEQARNERKLTIVAAVTPSGRAAIKRLLVDGTPVYDEPWF
ncbi:GDYXXLXY domain-containing protein [Bradyrhizobium manausense]|uniref:GDYXXLXY domain-containing protein n=1 Tax=Bradyrhizobium manausense TaxID=989370 RepID=UPI001BA99211|nr:GDYXXLXY domain-containing protein [Bradyrhizobium manausense]MBR0827464.1 GDYXXLXY domain-containing protein [Bradyrhizobium manausense]